MSDAWIAFARDGNPNGKSRLAWQPFDPERREVMLFDVQSRTAADYDAARRKFWLQGGKG